MTPSRSILAFLLAGGLLILYETIHPALDLFITAFGGWARSG